MAAIGGRDNSTITETTPFEVVAEDQRGSFRRNWLPTIRFILLCLALWLGLRVAAPSYAIEGESMSPTLHDGGRVILNGAYRFQSAGYGDVVVFNPPYDSDKPYIKRIVGLAGDTIDIHDGGVYRNGDLLDEPYLDGTETTCFHVPHCSLTIPEGMIYVLGDNRPNSSDSRVFGPVEKDAVLGEVLFSFWPLDDIR
ncbi:MAG TPA: signal peptidase I [Thermomicrobiales bacterium]|nr:signal peptidase I [Thermomicrobiales bacterium]